MNEVIKAHALNLIGQVKAMTGRHYTSVRFEVTQDSTGDLDCRVGVYADGLNHHTGKTEAEALESMRKSIVPDMLAEAESLEAKAAEIRKRAESFKSTTAQPTAANA